MTTITINDKTVKGKKLIEFLKTLDYVNFEQNEVVRELRESLQDLKEGRTKPIEQLFK